MFSLNFRLLNSGVRGIFILVQTKIRKNQAPNAFVYILARPIGWKTQVPDALVYTEVLRNLFQISSTSSIRIEKGVDLHANDNYVLHGQSNSNERI